MKFPFYIARRYFVSKKSHNIINIISGVSVAGVTIGTMALIIVLSVFNGFQELVISLFNSFNPDLVITARVGKTFDENRIDNVNLDKIPGILSLSKYVEENALAKYKEKQYIVTLKGVEKDPSRISGLDTMMSEGVFKLQEGEQNFAVLGSGVAYYLSASLNDYLNPVALYVPRRNADFAGGFENAFNSDVIFPSGFFSVQQDFDSKYILLPLRFVKGLLEYDKEITGADIWLVKGADTEKIQKEVTRRLGTAFHVKNRFQQQETLYKIMKSEKWAIFLILTFIIFIATFNVIGSLSMLILDKRHDIAVLQCLGANRKTIKAIFFTEGMMISLIGAGAGLFLGGLICKLQQVFGFVTLGDAGSTFVVSTYPVSMHYLDFLFVFLTVTLIGLLATWYPVYNIRKIETKVLNQKG